MYLILLRSSAVVAACVASIAVLGLMPARAGTGSDRLVRLTRCGPQRTDTSTAPAHPYEETAPVPAATGQSLYDASDSQQVIPVVPRRPPRSTVAAWWGSVSQGSLPAPVPLLVLSSNSPAPSGPPRAPTAGRAPPTS